MNTKTTPKDFFLHLGATVALYIAAIALMNLAFTAIDRALPDALSNYFSPSSIVWPISILIVLVPTLYVIEWTIARDISRMPEKREVWIRRWRIYLTLFLTGATIAGDLIVLINTFLNGEITSRFIWKVIVVLIVCAVIFSYYLLNRVVRMGTAKLWQKILMWLGIILVLAGIIGGFVIVGSPAKQRALRFDEQRVNDLTNIQYQVTNYWQRTGKLPDTIQSLNDSLSNYSVPVDPESGAAYEYILESPTYFQLCANFNIRAGINSGYYPDMPRSLPNSPIQNVTSYAEHGQGRTCFEVYVNPNLNPPLKK